MCKIISLNFINFYIIYFKNIVSYEFQNIYIVQNSLRNNIYYTLLQLLCTINLGKI